jgi:hypothetical protein
MVDKAKSTESIKQNLREGRQLTPAEVEELVGGPPQNLKKIDTPLYYASGVMFLATGNDFTLIFSRARPLLNADGSVNPAAAVSEPVAVVSVTPQTAKDLLLLLQANLPVWEEDFGEIQTVFSRQLERQKKEEKKEEKSAAKKKP